MYSQSIKLIPELIGQNTTVENSTTSIDVDIPTGENGDLLLAVISTDDDEIINIPAGWTLVVDSFPGANGPTLWILYRFADGTESSPITFDGWTNEAVIASILRYRNVDTSNPISVIATDVNSAPASGDAVCPDITTITDSSLIIRVVALDDNESPFISYPVNIDTVLLDDETTSSTLAIAQFFQQLAGATGTADWSHLNEEWVTTTLALEPLIITECGIEITAISSSNCSGENTYAADYSISFDWILPPTGDIEVLRNGVVGTTFTPSGSLDTDTVSLIGIPADGVSTDEIVVRFVNETTCADTNSVSSPAPCPPAAGDICQFLSSSQIRGTVFQDWNYDGIMNQHDVIGLRGVSVLAFNNTNQVDSIITDSVGNYVFNGLTAGVDYRVEFVLPDSIASWASFTRAGSDNGTSVQFAQTNTCVHLGIANSADFCQDKPNIAIPCYVSGDPLGGGNSGTVDWFVMYGYDNYGEVEDGGTFIPPHIMIDGTVTGSTWGIDYHKKTENVLAGAFLKRYSGLGQGGIGAIYKIDVSTGTPSLFVDLNTYSNVNTGTDPRNPSDSDNSLDPDYTVPNIDMDAFMLVGRTGLGDVDLSDDGKTLYAINLNEKTLVVADIGDALTVPATVDTFQIEPVLAALYGNCTNVVDYRPFALSYNRGYIYIGAICSAEGSENINELYGYVIKADASNLAGGFSKVFDFPLNYPRDIITGRPSAMNVADWNVWVSDWTEVTGSSGTSAFIKHPMPLFSDIDIDSDGSLVLSFSDLLGHQMGYLAPDPIPGGGSTLRSVASGGDVLRVCNINGIFALEGSGGCPTNGKGSELLTEDEYYPNEFIILGTDPDPNSHGETASGASAIHYGNGIVHIPMMDTHEANSSGVAWWNNSDGSSDHRYELIDRTESQAYGFAKGVGLGDLEFLCDFPPVEIGNYVWEDTDGDGVQDAGEPALQGVRMELYSSAGDLLAIDTTDALGEYYFAGKDMDNAAWQTANDTVQPNTTYFVVAGGNGQFVSNELTLSSTIYTLSSDSLGNGYNRYSIDSDGEIASSIDSDFDGEPYVQVITGKEGEVMHTFDFGFSSASTCTDTICLDDYVLTGSGENYQLNWNSAVTGWVTPPDDANLYPFTQTINLAGTSITAEVTLSHRANDDPLVDEHYACPSGCPLNNINDVDLTGILGQDTVFRFWKPTDDSIITVNIVFSEPILLYEIGMGGPASTGGGTIMSAWDDSIGIDANKKLDVLNANVVLPNPSVHPNPGVNHFFTATDDETAEPTVNYFAHDAQGSYPWGAGQDPTAPAPAPINYMDEFPGLGAGTGGDILLGQEDGFYFNLSRGNKRSWVVVDYAGMSVRSISWQLIDENDGDFDTALGNATATIGDFFDYVIIGNRSAYMGGFTVQKMGCPNDTLQYCLDGSGSNSVDISADPLKTSNIVWYNSDTIQVGTGTTLTVSSATLGMADSTEAFFYSGTDIATGCFGYACCQTVVNAVSCCPTAIGLSNQTCSDNSTPSNSTDDYITFDLNPSGNLLSGNYNVTVSSGTISPTSAAYGSATTFQLQDGSIGAGDVTVTITDAVDMSCTLDALISDPGECVIFKLTKTADKASAMTGDTIFYTYEVVNNGVDDLTLSDITDDKLGTISTETTGADRVTDQLQVLYRFEDGSGTTVTDNSGVSPAMDLTIQNGSYTWGADSLDFTGVNRADNYTDTSKVYSSITASGTFTVEAWIKPDNDTQNGAARILSQSFDNSNRNFQLMQNESRYQFRMRTTGHGSNEQSTATGIIPATTVLQHVVFTYDGTTPQFYLNGSPITTTGSAITGDFSTWHSDYDFSIGNEISPLIPDGQRDWQGEFHLAAVYSKALSAAEVSKNYTEGLGPVSAPTVLANGESATYSAFYEVTGAEMENPLKNIATITGTPEVGTPLVAMDSAEVSLGCITPSTLAFAIQPSCTNGTAGSDGYLQISEVTNGDRYHWSIGNTFDDNSGANTYVNGDTLGGVTFPVEFAAGQSNPSGTQDYTIRVYNGSNDCFKDTVVTMLQKTLEIGNYIWCDSIFNGVQDSGEPAVDSLIVRLYTASSQLIGIDTTINGLYQFDQSNVDTTGITVDGSGNAAPNMGWTGVSYGTAYQVVFGFGQYQASDGTFDVGSTSYGGFTLANQGGDNALDSDVEGATFFTFSGSKPRFYPEIDITTPASGCLVDSFDMGLLCGDILYSLGNQVFYDVDNSGDLSGSEVGIDDVELQLLNSDQTVYDSDTATAGIQPLTVLTANSGYYRFDSLPAGNYRIEITASNFGNGAILENMYSSSGANEEITPNSNVDSNDNGIDSIATDEIRSRIVTLGQTEPLGEAEPSSYGAGSITGMGANDGFSNLTVDFGFYGCLEQPYIGADQAICSGETITFIAYPSQANQTDSIVGNWAISPQSPSTVNITSVTNDSVIQVVFYAAGLGPFVDTVYFETATGCRDTALMVVNTRPTFVARDTTVCAGSTVDLTSLVENYAAITSPVWHIGTADGSVESTPTTVATSNTTAYFLIGNNVHGCKDTVSVTVTIFAEPMPSLSDVTICQGTTILLDPGSFAGYSWSSGETTQTVTKGQGTYTVTVTDGNTCTASATSVVSEGLISASFSVLPCNDNGTAANESDDYFTAEFTVTNAAAGASNKYLLINNGTTLNIGGTTYGSMVTVGGGAEFSADGTSTYTIVIQDFDDANCSITAPLGPVSECSNCPSPVCLPVTILKE